MPKSDNQQNYNFCKRKKYRWLSKHVSITITVTICCVICTCPKTWNKPILTYRPTELVSNLRLKKHIPTPINIDVFKKSQTITTYDECKIQLTIMEWNSLQKW